MIKQYKAWNKFVDWVRGSKSPSSLTREGWQEWREEARKKHPIRYWIAEDLFDSLEDIVKYIPRKIRDVKYYIINRFIDKSHCLIAEPKYIKPGQYMDLAERVLYCNFGALVDYVECTKAWHFKYSQDNPKQWKFKNGKSREAGLAHLGWEISLVYEDNECREGEKHLVGTPTHQAVVAKEIKELYLWWTDIYPNRIDPYDSGVRYNFDIIMEFESEYMKEDEEMLIRLMKIRGSLWS